MSVAIITGITGQDGAYLAHLLLQKKYNVIGLVRDKDNANFKGLNYLKIKEQIVYEECTLLDIKSITQILTKYKPTEIYNLAAQSSVSQSFNTPIETFQFNTISVFNLLESIRKIDPKIKLYQASSSEMFGEVKKLPITEDTEFHPKSPYAISKAAAHWTCVNYRESYNMFICCGILFNHESYLRSETFFVKKIIAHALKIKSGEVNILKVGNLNIKRDIGYAPKYVEAMFKMMQQPTADSYLICTGKSVSLQEIVDYVFDKLEISKSLIEVDQALFRPSEINDIYGSTNHIKTALNWKYELTIDELLNKLIDEEIKNKHN